MYLRRIVLIVLFTAHVGCGGRIAREESDSPPASPPSSSAEQTRDSLSEPEPESNAAASDGEWGTWQLLSLEGPNGRDYAPPFVELDLHPNGMAYRWTCANGGTGTGERCPSSLRRNCVVGTVELDGVVWRVQLENREGTQVIGRGAVEPEASGDITVNGDGALLPHAHYRRVAAASRDGCIP